MKQQTLLRVEQLFSVRGKHVLLTGGGRGIGKMMATGLVANGAHVAIASRDEAALAGAVEELNSVGAGGSCIALAANLGTRAGCEKLASDYAAALGESASCDVLINNSGASWGEPLERMSGKMNWGWDRVLDLNVKGPFYLTRAMRPLLSAASKLADDGPMQSTVGAAADPARVINIGSIAGILPQDVPTHAYDVSKAALHHLTKKMAADLSRPDAAYGPRAITVNAIAPGFVPTKMSQGLATWGADMQALAANVPLGRCGTDADMAAVAIFLSSPASAWMTGAIIPVDGGATGAACVPVLPDE